MVLIGTVRHVDGVCEGLLFSILLALDHVFFYFYDVFGLFSIEELFVKVFVIGT
jgi:hypothetical protein